MAKPVILAVDDDRVVLSAVERDLRREYGKEFRILAAGSGPAALKTLKQLKLRNEPAALLLADQRMPDMSGVEFLEAARELFPDARRVLLTAYADTDAAIRAINQAQIHYYLVKPWDPPEEKLYPVLNDLLDDWWAGFRPAFEGIRVVGYRFAPHTHALKDFLARNQVPYRAYDPQDAEGQRLMGSAGAGPQDLPLVIFSDGTRLSHPGNLALAEKVGLRVHAGLPSYDLIVVGAGPAGLAAGVYGASEGLRTLLVEREAPGGQAGTSSRIENYLGFPSGLSGAELSRRAVTQAQKFGAEILTPQEAVSLRLHDQYKVVTLADGAELNCRALLIATGVSYRRLDVPGLDRLTGAGVYYGAAITEALSCDAKDVLIAGGGNSAGQAAMYLARFARHVTIVSRAASLDLTMSRYLIDQIGETKNITVRDGSQVAEVRGERTLDAVVVANADTGACETIPTVALFIFIGAVPRTDWLAGVVARDEEGYILSGPDLAGDGSPRPRNPYAERPPYFLESSVPGIFVSGDVRHGSVKRIASAVGEGSMAVQFVHRYLAAL